MFSRMLNSMRYYKETPPPLDPKRSDGTGQLPVRNAYRRPLFLTLNAKEETDSLDINTRPIITSKVENGIPMGAGYAECINGGKSDKNEDQAAVGRFRITSHYDTHDQTKKIKSIEVNYYGIFDGHAGPGAALMAADQLINHLQEKLVNVNENLFSFLDQKADLDSKDSASASSSDVTLDSLVIGALEAAFVSFDEQIATERNSFSISGGCTALVAIILHQRLYVAHAGDCRAIACIGDNIHEMAVEFTPQTDSRRIQSVAHLNPSLTSNIFTDKIFQKTLSKKDLGAKVLFKAPNHEGWQNMTVTEADLFKSPLVIGRGKWAKLMGVIGVARGFGDHDLKVPNTDIRVKPFLTPLPEVRVLNLADKTLQPGDVMVMGCDGLWDLLDNEQIKSTVRNSLAASKCYSKAAESVVHLARGDNNGRGWKMADGSDASFDDICAFVIPLHTACQKQEHGCSPTDRD